MRERSVAVGILPNHLPVTRLGIRVKRGLAGAVVRNRLKRLTREAYRRHKPRLAAGWDVVVVLTRTGGVSVSHLEQELLSACTKLNMLNTTSPTA